MIIMKLQWIFKYSCFHYLIVVLWERTNPSSNPSWCPALCYIVIFTLLVFHQYWLIDASSWLGLHSCHRSVSFKETKLGLKKNIIVNTHFNLLISQFISYFPMQTFINLICMTEIACLPIPTVLLPIHFQTAAKCFIFHANLSSFFPCFKPLSGFLSPLGPGPNPSNFLGPPGLDLLPFKPISYHILSPMLSRIRHMQLALLKTFIPVSLYSKSLHTHTPPSRSFPCLPSSGFQLSVFRLNIPYLKSTYQSPDIRPNQLLEVCTARCLLSISRLLACFPPAPVITYSVHLIHVGTQC